jgi:hypothetical protein
MKQKESPPKPFVGMSLDLAREDYEKLKEAARRELRSMQKEAEYRLRQSLDAK